VSRGALRSQEPKQHPAQQESPKNNIRCKRNRAFGEFQEVIGSGNVRSSDARQKTLCPAIQPTFRSEEEWQRRITHSDAKAEPLAVGLSANMRRLPKARSTNVGQSSLPVRASSETVEKFNRFPDYSIVDFSERGRRHSQIPAAANPFTEHF